MPSVGFELHRIFRASNGNLHERAIERDAVAQPIITRNLAKALPIPRFCVQRVANHELGA